MEKHATMIDTHESGENTVCDAPGRKIAELTATVVAVGVIATLLILLAGAIHHDPETLASVVETICGVAVISLIVWGFRMYHMLLTSRD